MGPSLSCGRWQLVGPHSALELCRALEGFEAWGVLEVWREERVGGAVQAVRACHLHGLIGATLGNHQQGLHRSQPQQPGSLISFRLKAFVSSYLIHPAAHPPTYPAPKPTLPLLHPPCSCTHPLPFPQTFLGLPPLPTRPHMEHTPALTYAVRSPRACAGRPLNMPRCSGRFVNLLRNGTEVLCWDGSMPWTQRKAQ